MQLPKVLESTSSKPIKTSRQLHRYGLGGLGGLSGKHVIDRVGEIVNARYGDNDDVAMTLTVLGNPKESAAAVFAQIDRKKFSFDLQLS